MTPLQFAKEECSNYEATGACAGIGIRNDGSLYSFGRKARCVLSEKRRCGFFEECVLPAMQDTSTLVGQQRAKEHAEAVKIYAWYGNQQLPESLKSSSGRVCPSCRKRELEPGKQLCYVCREERDKQSNRDRARRHRQKGGPNITES